MDDQSPNSDNAPVPVASPFAGVKLNKPSGRAVGRQHKSIRSYEDDLNPMPEYADDPGLWNQRMRARMHGWLQKKGVKLQANRNTIIAGAFERTHGKPADVRQHFVALYLELRKLRAETAAYKADYRRSPTALRDIATEAHVGDHFARNILGADSMKWDPDKAVALAELRSSSERAVKDGDGQPIAASVKSDWSAAIEAGKKMQAAAETKQHTMDPEQAQYAIPNHIKRELSLDDKTIGKHVRAAFGKAIDLYINEHGTAKAWAAAESYVASQWHPGIGDAGAEPPEPEEKVEDYFGRQKITDQKPANEAKQDVPAIPIASPIPTRELVPQTAPVLGIANPMSEAAFVVLINLIAPWGAELKFTVRSMTAESLADQVETLIKTFEARGYTTQRAASPAPAAQQPAMPQQPATVPQGNNSGTATCVMIKVGTSFSGSKPQLEFECDGYEHPLRRTAANVNLLAQLLNRVTQINGAPFNAADLTAGRKFSGMWFIDWQEAMGGDEKMHRNVMTVRPATQANAA